jgi:protease I
MISAECGMQKDRPRLVSAAMDLEPESKRPRIAALVADGFQEEECLVPRFALQLLGARVETVSSTRRPVEIYSYFEKVGTYDVAHAIGDVDPSEFDGVLIPGGAKSPVTLSQDERVKAFVRDIAAAGKLVACICRGTLLAANAGVVRNRRVTGFVGDSELSAEQYRELAVEPVVVSCGGIWEDRAVVVDGNLVSSRHPRDLKFFTDAICEQLWHGARRSPFEGAIEG